MRYINKRSLLLIITILLVCTFGISYAAFRYYETGKQQQLLTGEIYLKFKDNTSSLSLSNIYPETKEEARSRTDNVITFNVSGTSTVTNKDVYYEVYLNEGEEKTGMTRFNPKDIVFDLIEIDESGNRTRVVDAKSFSDFNKKRIWVNTVNRNSTINKTYELRMWLSEDVIISDTESNASYTTSDFENRYLSIKVGVYGDFVEKELAPTLIKKIENTLPLTEADVDGTRFVYGADVDNNYVWYSGKLWRIVSINSDGSIKLVTQGNMTSIAWNTSSSTDYSASQIRTWLNTEFLPTLYGAENLLVDHEWDYTTYTEFPTQKITENTTKLTGEDAEKVGLINIYEFMMTGGTTNSSTSKTFLNNGYYWWTMSPKSIGGTFVSKVWLIDYTDSVFSDGLLNASGGARPSVNLKSGITILGGTGEKTNPYTLEGDKATGTTSELLSNRVSGEYINFNNTKYRIVGIETINGEQLTKVTMADYDINNNTIGNSTFGSSSSDTTYNITTGIGKYMYDWYNATEESDTEGTYAGLYISDTYKNMIATDGIEWYTGAGTSALDYTLSKTGTTIEIPIGLGYYGEMFSSQFGEGYVSSTSTWLITKFSGSNVRYVNNYGYASNTSPTYSYGARPSFYLKSNVKIVSGSGMPHDPYELVDIPPVCTISGDTSMLIGSTYTYNIECIDTSGFNDSEITIDDITVNNSAVLSVGSPVKTTITNGYKYALMITPLSAGTTTISLKAGSVSDSNGNANNAVTSSTITITKDTTAPVCTITGDTAMLVGNNYTYNIECTDAYGFSDSEITTSDITISNTSAISISTPVKSTITNGYKYAITVTPLAAGTTTISLKAGSVSDASGNANNTITSSEITVEEETDEGEIPEQGGSTEPEEGIPIQ